MSIIEIKHRFTGAVLWTCEATSLREAVVKAVAARAYLARANLTEAYLARANLARADLAGATMPDGRPWELYKQEPLAGICDAPEARERAISAWGNHSWNDCPMHAAHGWNRLGDAPEEKRRDVAAFVSLFDGRHLEAPAAPVAVE